MIFNRGDVLIVAATRAPAGKTKLIGVLAEELRALGLSPVAVKPIESHCPTLENHDIGSRDGAMLIAHSGRAVPIPVVAPYRFRAPGSSLVAARAAGFELHLADLVGTLAEAARYGDVLLVEMAGPAPGPVTEDGDVLDLCARVSGRLVVILDPSDPNDRGTAALIAAAQARGIDVITRTPV